MIGQQNGGWSTKLYMWLEGGMFTEFSWESLLKAPTPVAARSKLWIYSRSLAGIAGSNPTGGRGVCLVCVVT